MRKLRTEIEGTLLTEVDNLSTYDFGNLLFINCEGWIEALQYVLEQIDALEGEERSTREK